MVVVVPLEYPFVVVISISIWISTDDASDEKFTPSLIYKYALNSMDTELAIHAPLGGRTTRRMVHEMRWMVDVEVRYTVQLLRKAKIKIARIGASDDLLQPGGIRSRTRVGLFSFCARRRIRSGFVVESKENVHVITGIEDIADRLLGKMTNLNLQ